MSKEELLLDTGKELRTKSHDAVIYLGIAKLTKRIPNEYINSAIFSLIVDAVEKQGKIFLLKTKNTNNEIFTQFRVK